MVDSRGADRLVRIGGASGFWGDSSIAVPQLMRAGNIQYLVFNYLDDLAMGRLARARQKNTAHGYALDFVDVMQADLKAITSKGVRVVSNAGGVNPVACANALKAISSKLGILANIAVILGDDVTGAEKGMLADSRCSQVGRPVPARCLTANAHLGALPIKKALDAGAHIVVTGSCARSSMTLGVLMHEFDWRETDYDKLASGSLAGHLLECGCLATGGSHTDWRLVPGWDDIGYPVIEAERDGAFAVTKPALAGGLVTPAVISEQILYEVGDPKKYIMPDVTCNFSEVQLTNDGENRVRVCGAKGSPPMDSYEACAIYSDGYRVTVNLFFAGFDAAEKAEHAAEAILTRTRRLMHERGFDNYTSARIETSSAGSKCDSSQRQRKAGTVVLRMTVSHCDQRALYIFAREVAAADMSWAAGSLLLSERPNVSPLIKAFSFRLGKRNVFPVAKIEGRTLAVAIPPGQAHPPAVLPEEICNDFAEDAEVVDVPLIALAYGRSGDRGGMANIAVIARNRDYLPHIRNQVTAARAKEYLSDLIPGNLIRYDVPGLMAFNFVYPSSGGLKPNSFRANPWGKTCAEKLLSMPVSVPKKLRPSGASAGSMLKIQR